METNREKFFKIATSTNTELLKEVAYRKADRDWLRRANRIAAKVLMALKEQKLTQKDLAEEMNVSPQYINKLVKGGENLTTETITKLEIILGISIFDDSIRDRKTKVTSTFSGAYNETDYTSANSIFINQAV